MTSSAPGGRHEPGGDGDPLLGKVLDGRYRIEAVLGTGGVGVVYRARHLPLAKSVAVKVLHGELGLVDELRKRFDREAKVLSALSHPHIVAINDYGIADNTPYLVMELLEGRTLADMIDDDGPPDPELGLDIARQILRGLAFAHTRGIVHRDLKAANVFIVSLPDSPHHVKILDFGLAKIYATDDGDEPLRDRTLTKTGTILGTPAYMSPEQASGSSVDERTDVYSAGVVLFELLTGRYPFNANTRADMLRAHMLEAVPAPGTVRPGLVVTPELSALIDRAMSKERATRYAHAQAMLDALDALPRPAATLRAGSSRPPPRGPADSEAETRSVTGHDALPLFPQQEPTATIRISPWRRYLPVVAGALLVVGVVAAVFAASSDPEGNESDGSTERPQPVAATSNEPDEVESPAVTERIIDEIEAMEAAEAVAEEVTEAAALDGGLEAAAEETAAVVPPVDPFESVLPPGLRRYHFKVRAGRSLQRSERRALQNLQQQMYGDPRPTLVLAHHYVDINFLSDAIERYELAYQMDPASRGDARMVRDLVRLSGHRVVGDRAAALVEQIYGEEALAEIDRQIATTMDPQAIDGLMQLRSRIREAQPPE